MRGPNSRRQAKIDAKRARRNEPIEAGEESELSRAEDKQFGLGKYADDAPEEVKEAVEVEEKAAEAEENFDYDPSEHNVDEVLEYVEEHPEDERRVLEAERAGKNRKTIIEELEG